MQTIGEMLEGVARHEPERIAIIFDGLELTYAQLNLQVNRLAQGLISRGLSRGDRVMVFMQNSAQIVTTYFAIAKAGMIIVPLNATYRRDEITHIGKDTAAKAIIAQQDLWLREAEPIKDLPDLGLIVVDDKEMLPGVERLQDLMSPDDSAPPDHAHLDDIVIILYTSGTTGRPKGATQTHRTIRTNLRGGCSANKFCRDDRLLCALPLYNSYGMNVVMMSAIASAATLVIAERFDAREVLNHIKMHKCTFFAGTPTMFSYPLQEYDPNKDDVRSLRVTNSAGSHCAERLAQEIERVFGTVHLCGYGKTESSGYTCLNPLSGIRKDNSVGPALSSTLLKVVSDTDEELPAGQIGEVVEHGDTHSIHGYWNRSEVNERTYRGGWFHTGDLGYLDEDGYLFLVGRKNDLIITSGTNIYPAEIEQVLYSHPRVALAAVIGVPDELKGELPKAFIVLKRGETCTEQEIIDFVKSHIAKYKAPRMVEFVDSLPQGPSGKILKRELKSIRRNLPMGIAGSCSMVTNLTCPPDDPFCDLKPPASTCSIGCERYSVFSDELANRGDKCHKCCSRIAEEALIPMRIQGGKIRDIFSVREVPLRLRQELPLFFGMLISPTEK
jgi:long-chain acyl-CoA synthetase